MLDKKIEQSFLGRLIAASHADWDGYVFHPFVTELGQGTLPQASFRHYLIQDYLFLRHFVRAYALAALKADTLEDMRGAVATMDALLNHEMPLHINYCAGWGLSAAEIEAQPEAPATIAYTRYVMDTGLAGDILDLKVALIPCVVGYGVIGAHLKQNGAASNPYQPWIDTYSGEDYQAVALNAIAQLDRLAGLRGGDVRFQKLCDIFAAACRLEQQFWAMGYAEGHKK